MARINRRIYSKRRKRSPNKMFMAQGVAQSGPKNGGEEGMLDNVSRGLFGGFGGVIRTVKHAVNNAKPPYLNNSSNGESIEGNKTYTITKV